MLRSKRAIRYGVLCLLSLLLALPGAAHAFDARTEQSRLAEHIRLHPTDYEATYRYVAISTELRDYEAAIGALERLLMFNPGLARAEMNLGSLYARLGAYQVAAQHYNRRRPTTRKKRKSRHNCPTSRERKNRTGCRSSFRPGSGPSRMQISFPRRACSTSVA